MLVTASWGGEAVAVEVDAECRSVGALKRCLQEALPKLDVKTVCLEVGGRSLDDEAVLGLSEGSVINISATPAALAAATLREEGWPVDFDGFCCAAEEGEVHLCRLYLAAVGVVWPAPLPTPLHFAVRHDQREVVALLLDAGCEKDAKDTFGDTALHYAICERNLEVVKLLVDAGFDAEMGNKYGNTPLDFADTVALRNPELRELLKRSRG